MIEETLSATSDERVQVRSSLPKNKKYTKEEQVIPELLNHSIELQKEVSMRIYEKLVKINNTWTYKKVRDYWYIIMLKESQRRMLLNHKIFNKFNK